MPHSTHNVYDTDTHFVIDPVTRMITNTSKKTVIVQYDHNSERFTFEVPRYIDGHDMSSCNEVEIHFNNRGNGGQANGTYTVTDLAIHPDDENIVTCSWLISEEATQFAGPLRFLVRYQCTTDGKIDYAWSTAPYNGITVTPGIYNAN